MTYRFIDLFAGIGGMRRGFENAGCECVFSSEWDKYCKITYKENYGYEPYGDITQLSTDNLILETIPEHDILVAGFPCQPFSIAGVSKKNSLGREHGFLDKTQGTLFFNVAKILEVRMPKVFLLENVKNLKSHDKGNTFKVIIETLEALGYIVDSRVLDGGMYVPQHRERIFIMGFRRDLFSSLQPEDFPWPVKPQTRIYEFKDILETYPDKKYTISDKLWSYLQAYSEKHKLKGNGFGFGLVKYGESQVTTRTLSARYYKDGSEILLEQNGVNPRKLTPRECARIQGFPDSHIIPVSDTQAYKQFGNSVVVPLISDIAVNIIDFMTRSEGE